MIQEHPVGRNAPIMKKIYDCVGKKSPHLSLFLLSLCNDDIMQRMMQNTHPSQDQRDGIHGYWLLLIYRVPPDPSSARTAIWFTYFTCKVL